MWICSLSTLLYFRETIKFYHIDEKKATPFLKNLLFLKMNITSAEKYAKF